MGDKGGWLDNTLRRPSRWICTNWQRCCIFHSIHRSNSRSQKLYPAVTVAFWKKIVCSIRMKIIYGALMIRETECSRWRCMNMSCPFYSHRFWSVWSILLLQHRWRWMMRTFFTIIHGKKKREKKEDFLERIEIAWIGQNVPWCFFFGIQKRTWVLPWRIPQKDR